MELSSTVRPTVSPTVSQLKSIGANSEFQSEPIAFVSGHDSILSFRERYFASDLFHLRATGSLEEGASTVLTPSALLFLEDLETRFGNLRRQLLERRRALKARLLAKQERLDFLEQTAPVRQAKWSVAPAPHDLAERKVEITGPAERKIMINALNSGASVFIADLEDALSPTWANVVSAQVCLREAVRRTLAFAAPDGREYRLNDKIATLVVRPRGLHLEEQNLRYDGHGMSASLVDFGLYFFHNAQESLRRGSGPYFYLPKIESHLEARFWNDVFIYAQDRLKVPRGTIRATVLIETLPAVFEMEEILFELREHASGLNAGRWDYLFSMIKLGAAGDVIFPDRAQLTMTTPFMRAYSGLLVATCHKRGAHAIGGMAAFIPSRKDPHVNEAALAKVAHDKQREAGDGFDGSWVAHPDLVLIAREMFDAKLGMRPDQKEQLWEEGFALTAAALMPSHIEDGRVSDQGVSENIAVALHYISSWLQGQGAVAIHHMMEDAATAEIARAELWQWVKNEVELSPGVILTRSEFQRRVESERARFAGRAEKGRINEACALLEKLVLADECPEFLTVLAYAIL